MPLPVMPKYFLLRKCPCLWCQIILNWGYAAYFELRLSKHMPNFELSTLSEQQSSIADLATLVALILTTNATMVANYLLSYFECQIIICWQILNYYLSKCLSPLLNYYLFWWNWDYATTLCCSPLLSYFELSTCLLKVFEFSIYSTSYLLLLLYTTIPTPIYYCCWSYTPSTYSTPTLVLATTLLLYYYCCACLPTAYWIFWLLLLFGYP
jgi:hypothetical protein